jgi:hypothetical protein
MARRRVQSARGYGVGDVLQIFSDVTELTVVGGNNRRFLVNWPWREIDPDSSNSWDGSVGFPRDPDHYEWKNTPWRVEPEGWDLVTGDTCLIAVPETNVRITVIENYDPPAEYGWLPRPSWALGVCPLEFESDEEAGFMLYLDADEPIDIETVSKAD